jgi:glycosyltransferase involved in cell wall biosynthesis
VWPSFINKIRRPNLTRWLGCWKATGKAIAGNAALFVSHDPKNTFIAERFLRLRHFKGAHIAYSFNYSALPQGIRHKLHKRAFETVDRFVVYSTLERSLYHKHLGIPMHKLDFVHWGVNPPRDDGATPIIPGRYICALGENSRDYRCLVEAMRSLPHIPLVLVVRPYNVSGMIIPDNVKVMSSIPFDAAMNVLRHSEFMALPLINPDVPCGHVTLVNAMHLGKALAITRSSGVIDYVREGDNALMCEAGNVEEMRGSINKLWEDLDLRKKLGQNGLRFATENCCEEKIVQNFHRMLEELNIV